MKAYRHKITPKLQKGPFHGYEFQLSIGLIVKNEEKTLAKCLESLRPLLESLPSELIITDTGSTDQTVQIAEKYTDRIIRFDWCGDFAAARNTGLQASRGEWFLYLDGDEWFGDVAEIIEFFKSRECDRYGTASYIQRNYTDMTGESYNDFHTCRIFRMHEGIHFQNRIHEDITRVLPTKMLGSYVHHYGYVFANQAQKEAKRERNVRLLLEELEENKQNLKAYAQLSAQLLGDGEYEKAIFYARKGLESAENAPFCQRNLELLADLLKATYESGKYDEYFALLQQFLASENKPGVFHLEFLRMGQLAAFYLKQYEKTLQYGREYIALYQDYAEHKMDESLLMYGLFFFLTPDSRENCLVLNTRALLALKKPEEAIGTFRRIDVLCEHAARNGSLALCFDLAGETGEWPLAADCYRQILSLEKPERKEEFIQLAEQYLDAHLSQREKWARALAALQTGVQDSYLCLNRLRELERTGSSEAAREELKRLVKNSESFGPCFSDVLFYAMQEQMDLLPFLSRTDIEAFPQIVTNMEKRFAGFHRTVEEYLARYSFEDMKGRYWTLCLLERMVITGAFQENSRAAYLKLVEKYARLAAKYIRTVYRPEMLTEANLAALPHAVRFRYYLGEAFAARSRTDGKTYLVNLQAALKAFPSMKKTIGILVEQFEKEEKQQDAKQKEFARLAAQVKENIEMMIEEGRLREAGRMTAQLAALLPDDEDVYRFRKLTGTEPTMQELAANLPQ